MASIVGGLRIRERRNGRLVLSLSPAHRVVFGTLTALSVFILFFGVLFEGEPTVLLSSNVVAGLVALTMLFGLIYEDRWTFDRSAGRIENRVGTLPLARRRVLPMADLDAIALERFTRGRLVEPEAPPARAAAPGGSPFAGALRPRRPAGRRVVRLVAADRDGRVHVLDMGPAHRLAELRTIGLRVAGYCGVRFEDQTAGT